MFIVLNRVRHKWYTICLKKDSRTCKNKIICFCEVHDSIAKNTMLSIEEWFSETTPSLESLNTSIYLPIRPNFDSFMEMENRKIMEKKRLANDKFMKQQEKIYHMTGKKYQMEKKLDKPIFLIHDDNEAIHLFQEIVNYLRKK
jgi:hypothetical protein